MIIEIITYALRSYITYALLAIGGVIIHYTKKFVKESTERNNLLYESVRAILRNDIINMYSDCKKKGYCPIYVKDNVKSLAKPYHDIGGNGVIDKLVVEMMEMPTSTKESEKL